MASQRGQRASLWAVALLLCSACLSGCFYVQAARGQLALINGQTRLSVAIAEEPDPERKLLLRHVPGILAYARDVLSLPTAESYRGYVDVERDGLTSVVVASKKTLFEAYTWWFPFVGSVEYKSFFDPESAAEEAESLQAEGYDVYVGASRAYSTLGYLRDPVVSTMLEGGLPGLAEVLFHELAHQRLFLPSQTEWNEQFASFVAHKACERYFAQPHLRDLGFARIWEQHVARNEVVQELVHESVKLLQGLYDSALPDEEKLRRREGIFADLRKNLTALYPERRDDKPIEINNAVLLQYVRYDESATDFDPLFDACGGDFACFYRAAKYTAPDD